MATRLFVGNLPEKTEENELRQVFADFGEVTSVDLKSKPGTNNDGKKFAFVSLSASNYNIENCIKYFSNEDFKNSRLYVTRARESFLERLQREREQAQKKDEKEEEPQELPNKNPIINLGEKLNPRKRTFDNHDNKTPIRQHQENDGKNIIKKHTPQIGDGIDKKRKIPPYNYTSMKPEPESNKNKLDSEKKRMESMKKKRQEFKEKQMIIKSGLTGVDKVPNKKIVFSDNEEDIKPVMHKQAQSQSKKDKKNTLFDEDDDDSDREVNFEIKKQFEGKKGQKVLDLQSRYKSDKRFTLDERFIDEEPSDKEKEEDSEKVDLQQVDEKSKQLDILQDVLGVTLKRKIPDEERDSKKNKVKIGMLRFDPSQPEHAKFLAPVVDTKQESTKKSKKKSKDKVEENVEEEKIPELRPEVSKEQFYKVSENLKEAIAQPTTFSLRSLFGNKEVVEEEPKEDDYDNYIPIEAPKKSKFKNPLEPNEKNPFIYDSSDSEADEPEMEANIESTPAKTEVKAVWKENLFFSINDQRLKDGLAFFKDTKDTEIQKDRRELKSVMKKRIYNKERKNDMFKKKIGGRKKTMKKSFRKKS